jgi:hypothetical protein
MFLTVPIFLRGCQWSSHILVNLWGSIDMENVSGEESGHVHTHLDAEFRGRTPVRLLRAAAGRAHLATLGHFTGGRVTLGIVTGGHDTQQRRDADHLAKDDRCACTDECLAILRRASRLPISPTSVRGGCSRRQRSGTDPTEHCGRRWRRRAGRLIRAEKRGLLCVPSPFLALMLSTENTPA